MQLNFKEENISKSGYGSGKLKATTIKESWIVLKLNGNSKIIIRYVFDSIFILLHIYVVIIIEFVIYVYIYIYICLYIAEIMILFSILGWGSWRWAKIVGRVYVM